MTVKFVVPGNPYGKKRPRFGGGRAYNPKENREYEALVRERFCLERYRAGLKIQPFEDRPVKVLIIAYYPIPKSASRALRQLMISGANRPVKKPDWDNIGKAVCDALNGVAYKDDSQVVEALVGKIYSDTPMVEVEISDL